MAARTAVSRTVSNVVARRSAPSTSATIRPWLSRTYAENPSQSSAPVPTPRPQFPPAADPFEPTHNSSTTASFTGASGEVIDPSTGRKHGPLKVAVVKALARVMGYNSKSVTAIRETGTMCGLVVKGVEADREFWYSECALPDTYQTFFQLHLLYLLLLIPRLRSLRNVPSAIPNPSTTSSIYQTELLQHFFDLAENQMRQTLGAGERERTVKKYMQSMGEQWKGGGLGFDYALARGQAGLLPRDERSGAEAGEETVDDVAGGGDPELASWVWRNLYSARFSDGSLLPPPSPSPSTPSDPSITTTAESTEHDIAIRDLMLASNLQKITTFIRREVHRLEGLSDEQVLSGEIGSFGRVDEEQNADGAGA